MKHDETCMPPWHAMPCHAMPMHLQFLIQGPTQHVQRIAMRYEWYQCCQYARFPVKLESGEVLHGLKCSTCEGTTQKLRAVANRPRFKQHVKRWQDLTGSDKWRSVLWRLKSSSACTKYAGDCRGIGESFTLNAVKTFGNNAYNACRLDVYWTWLDCWIERMLRAQCRPSAVTSDNSTHRHGTSQSFHRFVLSLDSLWERSLGCYESQKSV